MRIPFIPATASGGFAPPDGDVVHLPREAMAARPSLLDMIVGFIRARVRHRYQPERYYMRGPGPAWHATHPPDWAPPRR